MHESSARKSGNPFDIQIRDAQRRKGLSSPDERQAVAADVAALGRDGYVVLEGLLDADMLAAVGAEMDRIHRSTPLGVTDFEGLQTRRIYNLMAKTRAADALCSHARIVAIAEAYLNGQIQLSSATGITLLGGETAQDLHRDDSLYPLPRPRPPLVVGALWAIDAYTAQNGGTVLVPGSHTALEDHVPDGPPVSIVMPAGSVLLFDGGMWHGGGDQHHRPAAASHLAVLLLCLAAPAGERLSVHSAGDGALAEPPHAVSAGLHYRLDHAGTGRAAESHSLVRRGVRRAYDTA